jgi:hypothetical protein
MPQSGLFLGKRQTGLSSTLPPLQGEIKPRSDTDQGRGHLLNGEHEIGYACFHGALGHAVELGSFGVLHEH